MSNKKDDKEAGKLPISDVMSGYAIRFNEVDKMGNIYTLNSFNEEDFKQMKLRDR